MISYSYTIQYVGDVAKTINFYEKAFGFAKKFISPEQDYAELATGETVLAFASFELGNTNIKSGFIASKPEDKTLGVEFVFTTDDVQGVVKTACDNGAQLEEPATEKPWGQTVAYVRDINGFLIEICTPMVA